MISPVIAYRSTVAFPGGVVASPFRSMDAGVLGTLDGSTERFGLDSETLFCFHDMDDGGEHNLLRVSTDGTGSKVFPQTGLLSGTVGIDSTNSRMYYYDTTADEFKYIGYMASAPVVAFGKSVSGSVRVLRVDGNGGQLYYLTGSAVVELIRIDTDGSNETLLVPDTNSATTFALDLTNSHIYYANSATVRRMNLDGTGDTNLSTVSAAEGMRLDISSSTIYVRPQSAASLVSVPYAGGSTTTITTTTSNQHELGGDGKIYFLSTLSEIKRIDTDGSNEESIYSRCGSTVEIRAIAVDTANSHVYFYVSEDTSSPCETHRIKRIDYDGSNETDIYWNQAPNIP